MLRDSAPIVKPDVMLNTGFPPFEVGFGARG